MEAFFAFATPVLFFGFIFGGAIWWGLQRVARATEQLSRLGDRLGLTLQEKAKTFGVFARMPELHGARRAKAVRVFSYTTGSGKSRTHWAAATAQPSRATNLTFRLSPQGFSSRILSLLGAKEIEIGDPAFDSRWFIQTNAPEFFRAALIPELRAKLDAVARRGGTGSYETVGGAIRYAERGWFTDRARAERFVEVLDVVCDLADVAEVHGRPTVIR